MFTFETVNGSVLLCRLVCILDMPIRRSSTHVQVETFALLFALRSNLVPRCKHVTVDQSCAQHSQSAFY